MEMMDYGSFGERGLTYANFVVRCAVRSGQNPTLATVAAVGGVAIDNRFYQD
jgi:hypothetical protein